MPVPGFRIGNSSSSNGLGMGIGPDIFPRMDWGWDFGRLAGGGPLKRVFMVEQVSQLFAEARI